jgi:O-antigen/teichoic acid export membrane protein
MIAGRGSYALADQAVQSAASFVTNIIVARGCTPAQFGVYILGLRLIDVAMEVENVTIWAPLTVLIPRLKKDAQTRYIRSTFVHQCVITGIVAIIMAVAGSILFNHERAQELARVMLMLACAIFPILLREYARRVGFARLDMRTVLAMDIIVASIQLVALWTLAHMRGISLESVYAVIGIAALFGIVVWGPHVRRWTTPMRSELQSDWRRNWILGKWFVSGNLTLLASTQIYPWSLSALHGTQATALLGAGDGIVNIIRAPLMAAQNILGPLTAHAYAHGDMRKVRRLVWSASTIMGIGTALFCVAIFFGGERFATLLYGSKFAGLGPLLFLMALNMLCMALTIGPSYALSAMDRPDVNVYINAVALLVSCTGGLWLVWQHGAIGAAIGLVIGNAVATILRHVIFVTLVREGHHP